MRHTRMRQIAKANKDPMWMWKDQVGTDTIELMTRVHGLGLKPKLDKSFKWIRFDSEHYKKTRNYYIFKGEMYARKIK
ncbi:TPA: hypothetical protein ACTZ34_005402 [Bacillus cereus]